MSFSTASLTNTWTTCVSETKGTSVSESKATSVSDPIILKQMLINSFQLPSELTLIIQSFLFYDFLQTKTRSFHSINLYLIRNISYQAFSGSVQISLRYNFIFQFNICTICGQYLQQHFIISHNALCKCYHHTPITPLTPHTPLLIFM